MVLQAMDENGVGDYLFMQWKREELLESKIRHYWVGLLGIM
jgi:hypothetical protein